MKRLICFILLCSISYVGITHPHIWNIANPIFIFNNHGLEKIKIEYIWDNMSSAQLIMEADKNKDNKLSIQEKAWLQENYFDHLQEYKYLTVIKINGEPYRKKLVAEEFDAYIDKQNRLIYTFTLPVVALKGQTVFFSFVDPTNFMAYETTQKTLQTAGSRVALQKTSIDKDYCRFSFQVVSVDASI